MKKLPLLFSALLCLAPMQMPVQAEEPVQETRTGTLRSQLNLLSYTVVNDKGEEISEWNPDQTYNVLLTLKDAGLKAADFDENAKAGDVITWIDVDHLNDGFKGGTRHTVTLLSEPAEPLRYQVEFDELTWKGTSCQFNWSVGYPSLDIDYIKETVDISQCKEKQEEEPVADSGSETDGIDWSGGSYYTSGGSDPVTIASATPNLIIKKYTFGGDSVTAGKNFTLDLTFWNTSKSLGVENIVMSVETSEGLAITNSSNTFYFDSLAAGASQSQSIEMKALSTEQTTSPSVSISFSYEYVDDSTRQAKTCDERIAIPVKQADRFEISEPEITETAFVGQEFILSFPYVNKGKSTLYNVSVRVDGDMETLMAVQNLGNYEPGKSGSIDVILTPETAGTRDFTVNITYEDADENEITKEYPFTLMVEEMDIMDFDDTPVEEMQPEESGSGSFWIWAALMAGIVVVVCIAIWKKKKKKPSAEEEDDFPFDDGDGPDAA